MKKALIKSLVLVILVLFVVAGSGCAVLGTACRAALHHSPQTMGVYRANDNDDNYYRHHPDKDRPMDGQREATYGYSYWESNPKAKRK